MSKHNVILIGCGNHSLENLIPSLAAISYVNVKTICDINEIALQKAKIWFPNAKILSKDNYLDEDIVGHSAVIVAGPPQLHEEVSWVALRNEIPVFVEKPPTIHTKSLVKLADFASENGIVTCIGHNLRHSDAAIQFQNLVSKENFGKPVAMEMRYMASKPRGVRWGLESSIRSFLLSHANHAIDLMIYQMGKIKYTVAARVWPNIQGGIAITVQFIFESGAVGNLLASSYAPYFKVDLSVLSDAGFIAEMNGLHEVNMTGDPKLGKRWHAQWHPRTLETGYHFSGYQRELETFFQAIDTKDNNLSIIHPSFQDEVEVYQAIDAIEESIIKNS